MKKLMIAAMLVGAALCGVAEDAKVAAPAAAPAAAVAPANPQEAKAKRPRPQFDRAKFEARMKARMEERKAKMAEVLKKYGMAEDKVGACVEELMTVGRRPPRPPRMPKKGQVPPPAKPAEAAPAK